MPVSTYTCETCSKSFKTNQHLTQHKNRKNKCKPAIYKPSLQEFDVNNVNTNEYSMANIIQLVLSYKEALDKNSQLENVIEKLKDEINEQKSIIDNLRIKEKSVSNFVSSYVNTGPHVHNDVISTPNFNVMNFPPSNNVSIVRTPPT